MTGAPCKSGTTPPPIPSQPALARAADWFARLLSGAASPQDERDWQAWLAASEEHRAAWASVERLRERLAPIHTTPAPRLAAHAWQQSRVKPRRRALLAGLGGLAAGLGGLTGAGALGYAVWRDAPVSDWLHAWRADHHTGTGEARDMLLADGSRVWLNAATSLNQRYQPDARWLTLLRGEVYIETGADTRAFYVETPHGRLHALGTRFAVRLGEDGQTLLAVFEGAVAIRTHAGAVAIHAGAQATVTVTAGEQRRFNADAISAPEAADPAREAWRRGLLIARHIPLAEVVAQLRPYQRGRLDLAPELAALSVFGSYPLTDPDAALAMLADVMPIRISRPFPGWVRIVPAP